MKHIHNSDCIIEDYRRQNGEYNNKQYIELENINFLPSKSRLEKAFSTSTGGFRGGQGGRSKKRYGAMLRSRQRIFRPPFSQFSGSAHDIPNYGKTEVYSDFNFFFVFLCDSNYIYFQNINLDKTSIRD